MLAVVAGEIGGAVAAGAVDVMPVLRRSDGDGGCRGAGPVMTGEAVSGVVLVVFVEGVVGVMSGAGAMPVFDILD
jgi:hypothetical protein